MLRRPPRSTPSLHDALPILHRAAIVPPHEIADLPFLCPGELVLDHVSPELIEQRLARDRKSTRLNSSHVEISYAVFCLKKKKRDQSSRYSNAILSTDTLFSS